MYTARNKRHMEGNKRKVKDAITKHKRKIIPWRLEKRDWFNKEWKGKKKELRRVLRELKKEE